MEGRDRAGGVACVARGVGQRIHSRRTWAGSGEERIGLGALDICIAAVDFAPVLVFWATMSTMAESSSEHQISRA